MKERKKLEEAQFFYRKMVEYKQKRNEFEFYLSAFLSAARSVLQYTLKEVKNKPGGQKWYNSLVHESIYIRFFKNKRDINIHEEPVSPATFIHLEITDTIIIADKASVDGYSDNTPVIKEIIPDINRPPVIQHVLYKFDDWQGVDDVFYMCKIYLDELENVVVALR